MNKLLIVTTLLLTLVGSDLLAQGKGGPGQGRGAGRGRGRQDPTFAEDHKVLHFLLQNRAHIQRQVKNLPNGIETVTQSNTPQITAKIQEHVAAMYDRVDQQRPIHMRDPLFRELFRHAAKIDMKMQPTAKGIHVVETSQDPHVVKLLQEHAKVVSLFLKNGHAEVRKNHPVPGGGR